MMSYKCKHGIRDVKTNLPYCRCCDDELKAHRPEKLKTVTPAGSLDPVVRPWPLPCPFCGTEAMVQTWVTNEQPPTRNGWHCGCLEPNCDINPCTKTRWSTQIEAVESWNLRHTDQAQARPEQEKGSL